MVNATIDNSPVFVQLGEDESTTVPTNEVWKVSIHLANDGRTKMEINNGGIFQANTQESSASGNYLDIVLVGGTSIAQTRFNSTAEILITGFVVDS